MMYLGGERPSQFTGAGEAVLVELTRVSLIMVAAPSQARDDVVKWNG